MQRAAELSLRPLMLSLPSPRYGVVIVNKHGVVVGEGCSLGQGSQHAEVLAVEMAMRSSSTSTSGSSSSGGSSSSSSSSSGGGGGGSSNSHIGNENITIEESRNSTSRLERKIMETRSEELRGYQSNHINNYGSNNHRLGSTLPLRSGLKVYMSLEPVATPGLDDGLNAIIKLRPAIAFIGVEHPITYHRGKGILLYYPG